MEIEGLGWCHIFAWIGRRLLNHCKWVGLLYYKLYNLANIKLAKSEQFVHLLLILSHLFLIILKEVLSSLLQNFFKPFFSLPLPIFFILLIIFIILRLLFAFILPLQGQVLFILLVWVLLLLVRYKILEFLLCCSRMVCSQKLWRLLALILLF